MRILLTNDDGIHAPGIAAMYKALEGLGEITTIAPLTVQSATGHGITFEVRPAKKGSPTMHVDMAGIRLPPFRLKEGRSVEEQVGSLQQVVERRSYFSGK